MGYTYYLNGSYELALSGVSGRDIGVRLWESGADGRLFEIVEPLELVRVRLYECVRESVRRFVGVYFKQYRGDWDDLVHEYWEGFVTPRSRRADGVKLTLLDRYCNVSGWPTGLSFSSCVRRCVCRKLIDSSRADTRRGASSVMGSRAVRVDTLVSECGDSVLGRYGFSVCDPGSVDDCSPLQDRQFGFAALSCMSALSEREYRKLELMWLKNASGMPVRWQRFFDWGFRKCGEVRALCEVDEGGASDAFDVALDGRDVFV